MSDFSSNWEKAFGSLPYGFSMYYAVKIEGIPHLFIEKTPDGALTATGHANDPTLMIDESAKVGSRIDENTGIGRAFDLTFGLARSATTSGMFKRPSNITRITSDVAHNATTITVDSTTGFAASGAIYIGNERIEYGAKSGTQFQSCTRGTPSTDWKGQTFPASSQVSTWVADVPMFFRGRRVILYAIPVDPFGRVVSSTLAGAIEIWRGNVKSEPVPYPGGWSITCRPLDRKLDDSVCASYSGKAKLLTNPDPKVKINPAMIVFIGTECNEYSGGAWPTAANALNTTNAGWKPFDGLDADTYYPISFLEKQIQITWAANVVSGFTSFWPATIPKFVNGGPFTGEDGTIPTSKYGDSASWKPWQTRQLLVRAKAEQTGKKTKISYAYMGNLIEGVAPAIGFNDYDFLDDPSSENGNYDYLGFTQTGNLYLEPISDTDYHWIPMPVMFFLGNQLASLEIQLDDEDPSSVPTAGWVVLENNDELVAIEYKNKSVEGTKITIETVNFNGNIGDLMSTLGEDESSVLSCKFAFIDNGQVVDTMRRMLYSSGRGNNDDGTYDTLSEGSGYDISAIDDNFAIELDGGWSDLSADFLLDENVSFVGIYGPLLALSQRAVVTRNTGNGMRLTVVNTSVVETANYNFTLKDEHIIAKPGSVKASGNPPTPNRIEINLERYKQEMGRIIVNDIVSQRSDGIHPMMMTINGFNRDEIDGPALGWSRSLFASRGGRLIYEVECVPWVAAQVGESIRIESTHFNFWDRSTGLRGYTGPARVMGRQVDLRTQKCVLYLSIAGAFQTITLAPSAKLTANNHTTSPTQLTVAGKYYDLMNAYLAAEPSGFKLLVYHAGTDQTGDHVTVNAITGSAATTTILAISAHTLSAALVNGSTHLTVPFTATDSVVQALHMHTDTDGAIWQ